MKPFVRLLIILSLCSSRILAQGCTSWFDPILGRLTCPPKVVISPSSNGSAYWDGTKLTTTPTGGAGTLCLLSANGGTPAFGSCAGSASTVWSSLSDPVANLSLSMGLNLTAFTWAGNTGSNSLLTLRDTTGNTGTGYLLDFASAGTSTLKPMRACAKGTSNCVTVDANALMSASGTGGISATHINGTALSGLATGLLKNTTTTGVPSIAVGGTDYEFPLTFSSPLSRTSNTISAPTVVTSAASLTSTAIMTGAGSQASQTPSATATLDSSGNLSTPGSLSTGVGGSVAGGIDLAQGTASAAATSSVGFQAPTSVTSAFRFTLPGAPAAGLLRATNATPSVVSASELSGDATTSTSNVVTVIRINGTSFAGTSGDVVSFGASNTPADSGFLATNVVRKDTTNTGAAGMTLDMNAATGSNAIREPAKAGLTVSATGAVGEDTTAGLYHNFTNGVDSAVMTIAVSGLASVTNGDCAQLVKSGSTVTLTTAGGACTTGGGGGTVSSGTAGQFAYYASNGTTVSGLAPFATNAKTSTYQVLAADFTACKTITVASGTFTITLVASGSQPTTGQCIRVANYGSGVVTIARSGQNINGGTSSLVLPAASATAPSGAFIVSDGTDYFAYLSGQVTSVNGATGAAVITVTGGTGISVSGGTGITPTVAVANVGIANAQLAIVQTRRSCTIDNDTQSATALVAAQLSGHCYIPAAATIVEVSVIGGTGTINGSAAAPTVSGTSSIQVGKYTPNGGASTTGLLSGALATASGKACAMTSTSGTCIDGTTSSNSITISTTALSAGDLLYVSAATADAAQTWFRTTITYTIN